MEYLEEIKSIVNEYTRINEEIKILDMLVSQKKEELYLALDKNKVKEQTLIDKIKLETGEEPDYYKIILQLNGII